jgi:hypothetical protein
MREICLPGWQSFVQGSQGLRGGFNSCQLGSQINSSPNISFKDNIFKAHLKEIQ